MSLRATSGVASALSSADFANPSALIGLTAVNGSALTALRSDAAPALDQSIAPTWTGTHTFSSAEPRILLVNTGAAANQGKWDTDLNGLVLAFRTRTDADGAGKNWLAVTRGATTAISNIAFGNATDNPTFSFLGTGATTFGGLVNAAGFYATGGNSITGSTFVVNTGGNNAYLYSDAANTLALRNGANAQTFNVYNTYTDASNYETGVVGWSSNVFEIGATKAGTGSNRSTRIKTGTNLFLNTNGSDRWDILSTGHFVADIDNTYDIGASGANRPRNVYVGTNLIVPGGATAVLKSAAAITSGAGASAGTLTNAPAVGNPTCWIPINDNGTTRYIPAW